MKNYTVNLSLITIIFLLNTACTHGNFNNSRNSQEIVSIQTQSFLNNRPDFFEQGRMQMENEIKHLEVKNSQSVLTIEAGPVQWQSMIFEEAGFTIWMPVGTMTEETEVIVTETGNINFHVCATHPESARFVVAYSDLLDSQQLANREKILTDVQNQIVNVTDFQINQQNSYNFGDYPGREFSMKNEIETIKFRVYLIDKRLYIIGASKTEKENKIPGAVETFLDSFKLNNT